MDLPVGQLALPKSSLTYNLPFMYRKAAMHSGYKWLDFRALAGPEQSRIVAFYRASMIERTLLSGAIPG